MVVNKEELTAEKLLKRQLSLDLLAQLPEPKNVWKYFLLLTEYPRKSHNLDVITKVLLDLAPKLGVKADVDAEGNIRFRKFVFVLIFLLRTKLIIINNNYLQDNKIIIAE